MQQLLNSLGRPMSIVGGTTAYASVQPMITARVGGEVVTAAVGVSSGSVQAAIYAPEIGEHAVEVYDDNGAIGVRIDQSLTAHTSSRSIQAVLEIKVTLETDLVPTRFRVGDVLGFRWGFTIEQPLVID